MELKFSNKFTRQLKQYKNEKKLFQNLASKIKHIKSAVSISEITELVKIRKTSIHYRIRIKISERKVYRIGIIILHRTIWFACIENDKKRFYKQFP